MIEKRQDPNVLEDAGAEDEEEEAEKGQECCEVAE